MTSPPGSSRGRRGPRARGFTLTELLVVLVIISLVGGLSAGALQLARRNYALQASGSRVEGIIRASRNASIQSGVPSRVVIDPVAGEAVAYGFETVGEWSFEEATEGVVRGARGAVARLAGGAVVGKGVSGAGLELSGSGHADCDTLSSYDLRAGVYAEAWIRWDASSGAAAPPVAAAGSGTRRRSAKGKTTAAITSDAAAILGKGEAWMLGIAADGSLEGRIGEFRARTSPGAVLPGRWTRVALWHDGEEVLLLADGIDRETDVIDAPEVKDREKAKGKPAPLEKNRAPASDRDAAPRPPREIPLTAEPLRIGGGSRGGSFAGAIDEVKVHGLVEPLRYPLGGRERFLGWRKEIRFDRAGRLDPRFHEVGVRVVLVAEEERPEAVALKTEAAVDYSVTFAEWAARRGLVPPEGAEAAEEAKLLARLQDARQIIITIDPSGALR